MIIEQILTPISPGELIDRITILEIKSKQITDPERLTNIKYELTELNKVKDKELTYTDEITKLHIAMQKANKSIWDSEDVVRRDWDDPESFIKAAKNSHFQNDERSRIKREINKVFGSKIVEEKSHPTYEHKG